MNDTIDKKIEKIQRAAYDEIAKTYKELGGSVTTRSPNISWEDRIVACIRKNLPVGYNEKTASVLEFGSGTGEILSILDKHCKHVTAVELSPEMAKESKKKAPNANIIQENILNLDFKPGVFDLIVANATIHVMPFEEAQKVLTKFANWLDKDGYLLITTTKLTPQQGDSFSRAEPMQGGFPQPDSGKDRFRAFYTSSQLQEMLIKSGFDPYNRQKLCNFEYRADNRGRWEDGNSWWAEIHSTQNPIDGRGMATRAVKNEYYRFDWEHEKDIREKWLLDSIEKEINKAPYNDVTRQLNSAMLNRRLSRTREDTLPLTKTQGATP